MLSALIQGAFRVKAIPWNGTFGITLLPDLQIAMLESFAMRNLKPLPTKYFWLQPSPSKRTRRYSSTTRWLADDLPLQENDAIFGPGDPTSYEKDQIIQIRNSAVTLERPKQCSVAA
jgi:hypothetical protein